MPGIRKTIRIPAADRAINIRRCFSSFPSVSSLTNHGSSVSSERRSGPWKGSVAWLSLFKVYCGDCLIVGHATVLRVTEAHIERSGCDVTAAAPYSLFNRQDNGLGAAKETNGDQKRLQ